MWQWWLRHVRRPRWTGWLPAWLGWLRRRLGRRSDRDRRLGLRLCSGGDLQSLQAASLPVVRPLQAQGGLLRRRDGLVRRRLLRRRRSDRRRVERPDARAHAGARKHSAGPSAAWPFGRAAAAAVPAVHGLEECRQGARLTDNDQHSACGRPSGRRQVAPAERRVSGRVLRDPPVFFAGGPQSATNWLTACRSPPTIEAPGHPPSSGVPTLSHGQDRP